MQYTLFVTAVSWYFTSSEIIIASHDVIDCLLMGILYILMGYVACVRIIISITNGTTSWRKGTSYLTPNWHCVKAGSSQKVYT
jgi:hypothetical protein